ncbi:TPA: hypothetical protein N0F65_001954 [Lagenidium giganteum]|uniref:Phosphatidylinositol-3-phosphatase n=1 Tax=Lagenidium giganteum TaxID=4803 RepID=A0AAV2YS67_9STRA|nr:TPA: hypothetical protein N0F65_001954 [Lagenidium giganteum]
MLPLTEKEAMEHQGDDDMEREQHLIGERDVLAAISCEYIEDVSTSSSGGSAFGLSSGSKKEPPVRRICAGKVLMTTYRFQFLPDPMESDRIRGHFSHHSDEEIRNYFLVPLGCISSVKKKHNVIEIMTKDFRQASFLFEPEQITRIHMVLMTYVFPDKTDFLFAFYHRLSADLFDERELLEYESGWDVLNEQAEWERQGVFENGKWRVSTVNKGFGLIESYPELLVVPTCIADIVLAEASNFRSIGRIPTLCWLSKDTGAVICRSSQPKVGMSKATSPADESLVEGISLSSILSDTIHIVDCRPMSTAVANRAKGYGVESSVNYKNCTIEFMNIHNIHHMRDSMRKLASVCQSATTDNLQWWGSVEDTKWLVFIRQLLKSAMLVASHIRSGESVLIHCSHGWDRTSQLSALAQIFLDPYYRTWEGFQVLVEKEWLSFGHPFQLRLSHGEKADSQESPIFVQFLDCVHQLVRLFPSYFEFNEGLLLMLAEALHSCRFGTFLFDCKKDRASAGLREKTVSVWTWVNGFRLQLSEESFVDGQMLNPPPSGVLRGVTLWQNVFLRWSPQPQLRGPMDHLDFFADNKKRILTWQLPHAVVEVLNATLRKRYKEAEIVDQLKKRIETLEKQLETHTSQPS